MEIDTRAGVIRNHPDTVADTPDVVAVADIQVAVLLVERNDLDVRMTNDGAVPAKVAR